MSTETRRTRAIRLERQGSLTARLVLPLVAASVVVVVGVVGLMYGLASRQLGAQIEARGRFLLNAVRYAAESKAGSADLARQVHALGGQRDVQLIAVATRGDVVAATRNAWVGRALAEGVGESYADLAVQAVARRSQVSREFPGLQTIAIAGPLLLFQEGKVNEGVAVVAIDLAGVRTELLRQTTLLAVLVLVGVAISAGLSVFLVHRFVLVPARAMKQAVQRGVRVPVSHADELGAVADALNRAFAAADARQAELDLVAGRLTALMRSFPAAVLVEDDQRSVVLANDLFCESFVGGTSPEAVVGRSAEVLLDGLCGICVDDVAQARRVETVVALGDPAIDDEIRLKDGRILERAYQPIRAEGRLIGHLWVLRDITERIRDAEQLRAAKNAAEQATRAKADFLATMSHEIRTPLNGVVGMGDLLMDSKLPGDLREQVDIIRASGRHLLTLINDILDYSRIEAGRLQLESVDFDPWAICEEVLAMQVPAARSKGLALHLEVADDLPDRLRGDPGRIKQILVNLSGNAVKFTARGSVRLRLGVRGTHGNPCLTIEVIDTGIGIPPEILPRLFQPFTQADSSTSRRFGGTGLGLAICKRLAEIMGGTIEVESRTNRGSVFRLIMPCQRGNHATNVDLPAHLAETSVGLAIDDPEAERLVRRCLRALGVRINDGSTEPGVIVSDLPGREARDRLGQGAAPVVGIGTVDPKAQAWASAVSMPLRRARLYDALNAALDGHSSSHATGLPTWPTMRVLVADDVAVNRIVVRRMLERHSLTVDLVEDGAAAVEAVRRNVYDLVLMDCHMPGVDGFQATATIVAAGPHPPIVALTADSMEGDRERCLNAGMDDYLAKPITAEALRGLLERWLGGMTPTGNPRPGPVEG